MLVRGWLIRKPVKKLRCLPRNRPAGASCPNIVPSVRQRKQGHSLNQGAKIMCKNQSEMRHFCTGETHLIGSRTSVSWGWRGASGLRRCWKNSVYWEMRIRLCHLCSKGVFIDDLAVWRHLTSVWHDQVIFSRFHQSQQKLWNYWRYWRVSWETILHGCEVRLCVIQDRFF